MSALDIFYQLLLKIINPEMDHQYKEDVQCMRAEARNVELMAEEAVKEDTK